MSTLSFNAKAADDLAKAYATPDMIAQREAVLNLLDLKPGMRVIDIGCGPGFLCESMAYEVGSDGHVLGIDISDDLITMCRARTPPAHLSYAREDALALGAADQSFDIAACTQVAEYIPDTSTVLSEMARVLRPGGRALIMATDWDNVACYTEEPERMQRVMQAWEGHCAHPRLPRTLATKLRAHGFSDVTAHMHPLINLNFARDTYSYNVLKLVRSYVAKAGILQAEAEEWFNELTRLDEAGQYYFASARMIFTATRAA